MRIHRCLIAFGIGVLVLTVAPGTEAMQTLRYEGEFQLPIPAAPGTTQGWMEDAVLNVPDHVIISDLDVTVTLTHTSALDLHLLVESPWGKGVVLNVYDPLARYVTGADYNGTVFDDEAGTDIQDGRPPFTGSFRPLEPLSAFDGRDACGAWRLQIWDALYYDSGRLSRFGLSITTTSTAPIPAPSALTLTLTALGLFQPVGRRIVARKMPRRSAG